MDWPEAQRPSGDPGPIYGFRRGYKVRDAGKHESADQYAVFQNYLRMSNGRTFAELSAMTGHAVASLSRWSEKYNWDKRIAAWQKDQMALTWRQADKLQRNAHREAIAEFRRSSERRARIMSRVSEDLIRVLGKRIAKAEEEDEEIPMNQVSGLLKAAASLNEQSREEWGSALGINELLEVVDSEVEKVRVEELSEEEDPYHFEVEE